MKTETKLGSQISEQGPGGEDRQGQGLGADPGKGNQDSHRAGDPWKHLGQGERPEPLGGGGAVCSTPTWQQLRATIC